MVKIRFHKKMESADYSNMEPGGMWWNYFGDWTSNICIIDLTDWPNDDLVKLCSALKSELGG